MTTPSNFDQIRALLIDSPKDWNFLRQFFSQPSDGADALMSMVVDKEVLRSSDGLYSLKKLK